MVSARLLLSFWAIAAFAAASPVRAADDVFTKVAHGDVDNKDVKIHYASFGTGPLMVMIHGFPDFWFSWREQMAALSDTYRVVATDQRGYNLSDKPKGQEQYDMSLLVGDVEAVVRHFKVPRAVIVGHDWGGMVAWSFAMRHPQLTERLTILNLPHPRGLTRQLATNPKQQENSAYARRFQEPDPQKTLTAEGLAERIADPVALGHYVEAFRRSDFEAMLDYYKQNYPRPLYRADPAPVVKVQGPVLIIHGLNVPALLAGGLNDTWEWVEKPLTLVTVANAGPFVQSDAAEIVSSTMKAWLTLPVARP